jgi:hypothetical protein
LSTDAKPEFWFMVTHQIATLPKHGSILAAAVTGAFGLLTVVIQRFKAENRKDHDTVMAMLRLMRRAQDRTEDKVDKVSDRLTEHITKH